MIYTTAVPSPAEGGGYTGPLDLVPGAVVAYSWRALSAAYRGSVAGTIREDGGDTTQAFNTDAVTGLVDPAAIATFLDGANPFVAEWNDQSGNARDVAQAITTNQPTLVLEGPNDLPSIQFDPSEDYQHLDGGELTIAPTGCTILIVCKSASGYPFCGGGFSGNYYLAFSTGGTGVLNGAFFDLDADEGAGSQAGFVTDSNSVPENVYTLIAAAWAFGSRSVTVDGAAVVANEEDNGTGPGSIAIDWCVGDIDAASPSAGSVAEIVELLVYNSILSAPQIASLSANMAAPYGITLP